MYSYDNVAFADKLPKETPEAAFLKLMKLKSTIDMKLKTLESKMKIKEFTSKVVEEETKTPHIKASVTFSLNSAT